MWSQKSKKSSSRAEETHRKKKRSKRKAVLSDLCVEDKKKISSLIRKLVHATSEYDCKERHHLSEKQDYENNLSSLRKQNKDILHQTLRLKKKFTQSVQLLQEYQKRLQHSQSLEQKGKVQQHEIQKHKNKIFDLEAKLERLRQQTRDISQVFVTAPNIQPPPHPMPHPRPDHWQGEAMGDKCRESFCLPPQDDQYGRIEKNISSVHGGDETTSTTASVHRATSQKWDHTLHNMNQKERRDRIKRLMSIQNSSSASSASRRPIKHVRRRDKLDQRNVERDRHCAHTLDRNYLHKTDLIHEPQRDARALHEDLLFSPYLDDDEFLASSLNRNARQRIASVTDEIDLINQREKSALQNLNWSLASFGDDHFSSDLEDELDLIRHLNTIPQQWTL